MSDRLVLAWEARDPASVEGQLEAVGFRRSADGSLLLAGLVVRVVAAAGLDRLRFVAGWPSPGAPLRDDTADAPAQPGGSPVRPARRAGLPALPVVGIATIDADRLGALPGRARARPPDVLPPDQLLGARVTQGPLRGVVLLEPATEGRLAATLARHGEGPAALYVAVSAGDLPEVLDRLAGSAAGPRPGDGPFGPQVLARPGPPWGPHLLVVPTPPSLRQPRTGRSATIRT